MRENDLFETVLSALETNMRLAKSRMAKQAETEGKVSPSTLEAAQQFAAMASEFSLASITQEETLVRDKAATMLRALVRLLIERDIRLESVAEKLAESQRMDRGKEEALRARGDGALGAGRAAKKLNLPPKLR